MSDNLKFKILNHIRRAKLKPAISAEELSKKHKVPIKTIIKALDDGQKVEMEHTDSQEEARHIASHHIEEFLNYYVELKMMEDRLKKRKKKASADVFFVITIPMGTPQRVVTFVRNIITQSGYDFNEARDEVSLLDGTKYWQIDPKADKESFLTENLKVEAIHDEFRSLKDAIIKFKQLYISVRGIPGGEGW